MSDDLLARDARHCWHPYTQHGLEQDLLPIAAASGAVLTLEDGTPLIDAISSWWACLHGHGHPALLEAMRAQAERLDHVLFAGTTHEPATRLAEELVRRAPPGLTRVFYSDDGSTAVEVALKMVYQQWVHRGEPERRVFVGLENSYHGDTFGAMSVADPDPFFVPFRPLLFEARRARPDAAAIAAVLESLAGRAAGVIVEPLVQGAGGMRMYPEETLRGIRAACDTYGVPLIADEVMTGFGRTGALFACGKAGIAPDVLCLGKGLTGGTMPLAATLAREDLFGAFLSNDRGRAFFHGHTFTGHPIGCAVALASLRLCEENDVPARLDAIGARIEGAVQSAYGSGRITEVRRTGGIVALELKPAIAGGSGYLADRSLALRRMARARGVLLRPLGPVLYAMPPACTDDAQCDRIAQVMVDLAGA